MTPEEKQIKIAEVCGWTDIVKDNTLLLGNKYGVLRFVPDYLNDLNALHEVVLLQSKEFQRELTSILLNRGLFTVTKPEWAEIFIDVALRKGVIKE